MKSKHTPGPWNRVKGLGTRYYWTLGRIVNHIAEPLPERNEDADWLLAEAAPELLEACKKARSRIQQDIADNPATKTNKPEVVAELSKAIAKAEGGTE